MTKQPAPITRTIFSLVMMGGLALMLTSSTLAQEQTPVVENLSNEASIGAQPTPPPPASPEPLNKVSLTASPPRLGDDRSLTVKPGESKQVEVRVINTSEVPITFRSSVRDFLIGVDGITPEPVELAGLDNRWSLASWLTIAPNQQTVNPGESATIAVLIDVPADALPGGHYAMITHQPVFDNSEDGEGINQNSTGVNQRVGTLLYLLVEGPINEAAFIRNLQVPGLQEFGPVEFSFELENQSDVHIQPQIGVTITNIFGSRVGEFQPETRNIFPFTSRPFESEWLRIWGFGRYKLEVVASYGTAGQLAIDHAYFWLIPIKLIIAILCIVLVLIAFAVVIRRHWLHRQQDQSKRIAELEAKLKSVEDETAKKSSKKTST